MVSAANPCILVHCPKKKVDGITKYIDNHSFEFDNAFNEAETTEELYEYSIASLIPDLFENGLITVFAYGQTSSGKTFTMQGLTELAIEDLFASLEENKMQHLRFRVSFFEIYGEKCFDLLNGRSNVQILEDSENKVSLTLINIDQDPQAKILLGGLPHPDAGHHGLRKRHSHHLLHGGQRRELEVSRNLPN